MLMADVLKRDLFEGEKAEAAKKKVARSSGRMLRSRKDGETPVADEPEGSPSVEPPTSRE
ncbi:hypothetical protein D3C83_310400 [compost metagenome]